jgi:hypothetical protein
LQVNREPWCGYRHDGRLGESHDRESRV